jgi:hypothetical protein
MDRRIVIHGMDGYEPILPFRCCNIHSFVDGRRENESIVVVGVLADEIHPARSRSDKVRFAAEGLSVLSEGSV